MINPGAEVHLRHARWRIGAACSNVSEYRLQLDDGFKEPQ